MWCIFLHMPAFFMLKFFHIFCRFYFVSWSIILKQFFKKEWCYSSWSYDSNERICVRIQQRSERNVNAFHLLHGFCSLFNCAVVLRCYRTVCERNMRLLFLLIFFIWFFSSFHGLKLLVFFSIGPLSSISVSYELHHCYRGWAQNVGLTLDPEN